MGVICPPGCWLRVGNETRSWTEGGFLIFDDSVEHEARNETDTCRAILLFDFFRGAPEEEVRRELLETLRTGFLGASDYAWLLSADISCDDGFLANMRAADGSASQRERDIRPIVDSSGLYFP